ncbi:MAG TPA: hypothetical protein ENH06_01555 [bacterium]|nr:hypothetical protein [bacterium]
MLVKILGTLDLSSGLILTLSILSEMPSLMLIIFGATLLAKSLMGFLKDFGSWIDFLAGGILILTAFISIPLFIKIIFSGLLIQKGISSFL